MSVMWSPRISLGFVRPILHLTRGERQLGPSELLAADDYVR